MNSGNPKGSVESYAKETKFEWPVLVDEARETEKQAGVGEVSLQNIYQWVVVDPEGKLHKAGSSAEGAEGLVQKFLPSAKMLFDGVEIPERLKPLARDLELGIYEPGVAEIASLSARSGPLAEAAKAMYEKLKPTAESGLERGKAAKEGGRLWTAYEEYEAVALAFKRTPYEKTATAALAELKKEKTVKDELAARQLLAQAKALRASGRKNDAAQAQAILQALQKRYPETEAARTAATLK